MLCLDVTVYENEEIDDLQYKGLKIIQKRDGFRFGIDAVLLANFADFKAGDEVIDLGTGTGIIPILVAGKTEVRKVTGIEIQFEMAEMAMRSVKLNNLDDRVSIVWGDLRESVGLFGASRFNVVTVNPPYMTKGGGLVNPSDTKAISRHEIMCSLEDVIKASSKLLVPGGQLAMVHRPERLVDIVFLMRSLNIEPKYMRFVHPSIRKKPNLVLIKGTRNGNPQLRIIEPLYIYDEDGNYSDEINRIYNSGKYSMEELPGQAQAAQTCKGTAGGERRE